MMSQAVPVWMSWLLGKEPNSHPGLLQKMPSELNKRPGHHRNRNPLPIFHQSGVWGWVPLTSWLGGRHRAPVECRAIPGHSPHLIAGSDGDRGEGLVRANMQPGGALEMDG